jgi:hypothetical protein
MHSGHISIWFFIGVLLSVYGFLIAAYGLYEVVSGNLANVVLKELHTPLWWGSAMLILGLFYAIKFRPGRNDI